MKVGRRKDGLSFIVSCNSLGRTWSWGASRKRLRVVLGVCAVFLLCALISFFASYKFYWEAKDLRTNQRAELDELLSTVEAMSNSIIVDRKIEQKFIDRVMLLEEKLASVESEVLFRKRKNPLMIGGQRLGVNDIGDNYFNATERDIKHLKEVIAFIPLGKPVSGGLSSNYGYRKDPFSKTKEFHAGVDFKGHVGDTIIATADGVVKKTRNAKGGYGKHVVIKHKNGYETLYGHLSKISVTKNQKIKAGDKIGELGSTGRSTGPHLHYEIIRYGKRVNPGRYIR